MGCNCLIRAVISLLHVGLTSSKQRQAGVQKGYDEPYASVLARNAQGRLEGAKKRSVSRKDVANIANCLERPHSLLCLTMERD